MNLGAANDFGYFKLPEFAKKFELSDWEQRERKPENNKSDILFYMFHTRPVSFCS